MTDSLIAAKARARFVVTLPPEPNRLAEQLQQASRSTFVTFTDTRDAFRHLAQRAKQRLVVMTPFIDAAGAAWAADLFETTAAQRRELVLRDSAQLGSVGLIGDRLRSLATRVVDYEIEHIELGQSPTIETFHAKVVLADGVAAYVGSANFLYRSREVNLECGFLLEGDAVQPVCVLVDAVMALFNADGSLK